MNLFERLVDDVLSQNRQLQSLQPVVEKEILHHDILRELSHAGLLRDLTFIGGTCLRDCYGSPRLSEDLDFTGGPNFQPETLGDLGPVIEKKISEQYGLIVKVTAPAREGGDTKTWKIRVITRPEQPHLPSQQIHIDVCTVSSFEKHPVMLRNHYQVDFGTLGLIFYAESREEIVADKLLALALRTNRVKHRDIWDIVWLNNQSVALKPLLVKRKLEERNLSDKFFCESLHERINSLRDTHDEFLFEIRRFLPAAAVEDTLRQPEYWTFVLSVLDDMNKIICIS